VRHAAIAVLLMATACGKPVLHGLDERQANEIQSVLVERGLDAEKVVEPGKKPSWSIEVPQAQASDAVRIVSELGFPRPRPEGILDVFGKESLMRSPVEEQALVLHAREGELAGTLESVDGVVSAGVHLVLPPPPRPGTPAAPAKASVFLRVRPGTSDRVARMKDELRALIAGGVENLDAGQVTLVVSEVSTAVPTRPGPVPPAGWRPLRVAVAGLGATVSALSLALVWLALRLRRERARVEGEGRPTRRPASPAPGTAAAPRKVA